MQAVSGLTLDVRAGEVHAICGHNGAGKSTLVKTLVGLVRPDAGELRFAGEELVLRNPQDAQARGIAIVNQELSLVPALSVEDNIFLGGIDVPLLYRRRELSERARRILDELGLGHVPLSAPVDTLAIGERQLVEIARLLARDARLLILDEPTATLSKPEIERVFRATRELVSRGRSVIFVSHRLDEVFDLCDRITVLRDGKHVATHDVHAIDRRSLIDTDARRDGGGAGARGPRRDSRCSHRRAGRANRRADRPRPGRRLLARARTGAHRRARRAGRLRHQHRAAGSRRAGGRRERQRRAARRREQPARQHPAARG